MKDSPDTRPTLGRFLLDVAAETLWPTRCAVCDAPGKLICDACAEKLPYIDSCKACARCGAPYGAVQCTECNRVMLKASGRAELPLAAMASVLSLDDAAHRIAVAYKDQGERRLAELMAASLARYVPPDWTADGHAALTFVPATAARRRRGFDHAELIAQKTAALLGIPCVALFSRPRSFDQRKLSRAARIGNMSERFNVLPAASIPASTIIVDDVCTTGSTLYAAADALAARGAKRVFGLTFARA